MRLVKTHIVEGRAIHVCEFDTEQEITEVEGWYRPGCINGGTLGAFSRVDSDTTTGPGSKHGANWKMILPPTMLANHLVRDITEFMNTLYFGEHQPDLGDQRYFSKNYIMPWSSYVNAHGSGDPAWAHRDCMHPDDKKQTHLLPNSQISVIVYLNDDLTPTDYGETIFFDDDDNAVEIVSPTKNRFIIFDGVIKHRLQPPSQNYAGYRYSMPFKCCRYGDLERYYGEEWSEFYTHIKDTWNIN